MSYILDALRRAEAERERGGVPGLHAQAGSTVGAPPTRSSAPAASWALPAILALALLAALLAWRPWAADGPATPAAAPGALPALPAAVERSVPIVDEARPPPPAATVTVPPAGASSSAKTPPLPTVSIVAAPSAKKRVSPSASSAVAPAPPASGGVVTAPVPSAVSAAARVPSLAEVPDDIRREVPQLTIGGSIYSTSPASRFVIVNGQLFHEGDTVAPGLVLEQIRLKSAVLAFKGYRYSLTF